MSQRSTKRIDGVMSATVGNDWITLNFESHQITLNNMQIYNAHVQSLKKRITEVEAELTKEREASQEIKLLALSGIEGSLDDADNALKSILSRIIGVDKCPECGGFLKLYSYGGLPESNECINENCSYAER